MTRSRHAPALVATLAVVLGATPGAATDIVVDSTFDDLAANGNCTLREAIVAANTNAAVDACAAGQPGPPDTDRVLLPAGIFALSLGAPGEDAAMGGDLDLTDNVVIEGVGARLTIIDADDLDRVFDVDPGGADVVAALIGLTARDGDSAGGDGGGIRNGGTLSIERVTLESNTAGGPGGAIRNNGDLFIVRSTVAGNTTADHGGGVDNHGQAFLQNSTVSGNSVTGGGVGGGLYNDGGQSMTLMAVTVTGNTAGAGNAIHNAGDLTVSNALLVGGCDGGASTSSGGSLESPGDTCDLDAGGDQSNVGDPMLGPLADNGGGTDTHALLAGGPAIDTGANGLCPTLDQRGRPRPADGDGDRTADCDIGAYEREGALEIFADGFESGDTSSWSVSTP